MCHGFLLIALLAAPCPPSSSCSLKDFFPSMDIKPNITCCNSRCIKAQEVYQVRREATGQGAGGREIDVACACVQDLF